MPADESIAQQLHNHAFGDDGPTNSLINEGVLPEGWAAKYLQLLETATKEWRDQPMWPRELVAAIHFASWYLNLRYDSWCSSSGRRNEETECELQSLRSPSEIFLMRGSLKSKTNATQQYEAREAGLARGFEMDDRAFRPGDRCRYPAQRMLLERKK